MRYISADGWTRAAGCNPVPSNQSFEIFRTLTPITNLTGVIERLAGRLIIVIQKGKRRGHEGSVRVFMLLMLLRVD